MLRAIIAFSTLPLITSCVAPSGPPPAPRPAAPVVAATPTPAVATPAPTPSGQRYTGDWSVADLGPEEWRYEAMTSGSRAALAAGNGSAIAAIGCQAGTISLSRPGNRTASGQTMTIRTSFAERSLPIRADISSNNLVVTLDARDPLWDQIIYSRGRFLIEASGVAPLIAPVRPEIGRVVENCRGAS
jgi:hypothetical protein